MTHYTELDVWKVARELVTEIYQLTADFPKEEIYTLTSQMRRCAVSVPSNIAEGQGRNTAKDSLHFFYISRGSLYELETQLYITLDLKFCSTNQANALFDKIMTCRKLLSGLINYFKKLV